MSELLATPIHEPLSSQETLPREPVKLTAADQDWLTQVGVSWPTPKDEERWLRDQNEIVHTGSRRLRGASPEEVDEIVAARDLFLGQLTYLNDNVRKKIDSGEDRPWPIDTLVGSLRFLSRQGIDAAKAVNVLPSILGLVPESIKLKLDNLTARGIDAVQAINTAPSLLSSAPETVNNRLDNLNTRGLDSIHVVNTNPSALGLSIETINARLDNLSQHGLDSTKCINAHPALLSYSVDSVNVRIDNLVARGIDIVKVVNKQPGIIGNKPETVNIKLDSLASQGLDPVRVVNKQPTVLSLALDTVKEHMANLYSHGIDAAKVVNAFPSALNLPSSTINSKIDHIAALGLDPTSVINREPSVLGIKEESLAAKMRIMYAAGRSWKLENTKQTINKIVEQWPTILGYSPTKLRTLITIASEALPNDAKANIPLKDIQSAVINNLEQVLVAYLELKDEMYLPQDIGRGGYTKRKVGKEVLRAIIAQHSNDRAVRAYLKGYSLDD